MESAHTKRSQLGHGVLAPAKCGVITSSYEIMASMMLSAPSQVQNALLNSYAPSATMLNAVASAGSLGSKAYWTDGRHRDSP